MNPSEVKARNRSAPDPSEGQIFKYHQELGWSTGRSPAMTVPWDTDLKLFIHKSSGDLGKMHILITKMVWRGAC